MLTPTESQVWTPAQSYVAAQSSYREVGSAAQLSRSCLANVPYTAGDRTVFENNESTVSVGFRPEDIGVTGWQHGI